MISLLKKISVTFTQLAIVVVISSCANSNLDNIHDAQACLDKSTPANAMTCYAKVAGDNSSAASLIRCASILVAEGLSSATVLQNAINHMTGAGASTDAAMSALAFTASGGGGTSNATDLAQANDAITQCNASGSTGLSMLSMLASIATAINNAAIGFTPPLTGPQVTTVLAAVPNAPALMQTSFQQNCTGTVSSANQSFCNQYATAQNNPPGNCAGLTTAACFLKNMN